MSGPVRRLESLLIECCTSDLNALQDHLDDVLIAVITRALVDVEIKYKDIHSSARIIVFTSCPSYMVFLLIHLPSWPLHEPGARMSGALTDGETAAAMESPMIFYNHAISAMGKI